MSPAATTTSRFSTTTGPIGTTSREPLAQQLTALGLEHSASCLPELVERAAREQLAPTAFLDVGLTRQLERTDERRVTTMRMLSGLPPGKTLEEVDWTCQPRVDRRPIEALATCRFIRERQHCRFLGPPGVGQSHRSCALGGKAIKNGFSTTDFVLNDRLHALNADAAIPPARLRAKRYLNRALLIVDEVGFRPLDRHEATRFFRLVSARYERASIIVATNKPGRDWPDVFAGDEILTTAILDRLLHHFHVIHIDGRSDRLRELDRLLAPRPEAPPPTPETGGAKGKHPATRA